MFSNTMTTTGMVFHGNVHGRYNNCPYGISRNMVYPIKVHTQAQVVTSWSSGIPPPHHSCSKQKAKYMLIIICNITMCCDVVEKNETCECVGMYNYTWSLASTSHLEEKIIGAQKNEFRPPTSTYAQTIKLFLI